MSNLLGLDVEGYVQILKGGKMQYVLEVSYPFDNGIDDRLDNNLQAFAAMGDGLLTSTGCGFDRRDLQFYFRSRMNATESAKSMKKILPSGGMIDVFWEPQNWLLYLLKARDFRGIWKEIRQWRT
jgi:hypothetical protein